MAQKVEIISVGEELLRGKVSNLNARWLAKRAATLGLRVDRIVTVADDAEVIASAVQEALQRRPRFLITTGGLGPTSDDKTVEGIGKGIGHDLELNEPALKKIVERWQAQLEARESEFSPQDLKRIKQMLADHERGQVSPYVSRWATIPKGSRIIFHPDVRSGGLGITIDVQGTTLIALPGVPQQVKAIFKEWVQPLFKAATGKVAFLEKSVNVVGIGESRLSPLIDQVMLENPRVYIKSSVRGDMIRDGIELYLSTTAENARKAENCLNKALNEISGLIREMHARASGLNQQRLFDGEKQ
jgi:nicotinamide-nucleotide amidase